MSLSAHEISALASGFGGMVIAPDQPDYDMARGVFNAMSDKRPAVTRQTLPFVAKHYKR